MNDYAVLATLSLMLLSVSTCNACVQLDQISERLGRIADKCEAPK